SRSSSAPLLRERAREPTRSRRDRRLRVRARGRGDSLRLACRKETLSKGNAGARAVGGPPSGVTRAASAVAAQSEPRRSLSRAPAGEGRSTSRRSRPSRHGARASTFARARAALAHRLPDSHAVVSSPRNAINGETTMGKGMKKKKLTLNKETIKKLTDDELSK